MVGLQDLGRHRHILRSRPICIAEKIPRLSRWCCLKTWGSSVLKEVGWSCRWPTQDTFLTSLWAFVTLPETQGASDGLRGSRKDVAFFPCWRRGWIRREGSGRKALDGIDSSCWLWERWWGFEIRIERWGHIEERGSRGQREMKWVWKGLIRKGSKKDTGKHTGPWPWGARLSASHSRSCLLDTDKDLGSSWAWYRILFGCIKLTLHVLSASSGRAVQKGAEYTLHRFCV